MGKHTKKLAAFLTAGLLSLSALPALNASAAVEWELIGYYGDLNGDMSVNVNDAVLLMRYLTADEQTVRLFEYYEEQDGALPVAYLADLDGNQRLNAADLTLLKRLVISGAEPEGIYREYEVPDPPVKEEMIDAPINALRPTLACKGHNKLLMLVVEFPDCKFKQYYTPEQIREISFGAANPNSQYYPLESVIGYYERASYGALTMDADIITYTAQSSVYDYIEPSDDGKNYANATRLVNELMADYDDQIDFSKYDVNGDGTMDTILLSVADNAPDDGWWPCSGGYAGNRRFDGVKPGNIILGNASPQDVEYYNNTWIHELGHAMGLPDYYKYQNTENGYYGLNGPAGTEMMDDAFGDFCAYSKLMYGWYTPSQIQVYTGGTQTFRLKSSQAEGGCVIIPRGELNGYLSEYMILEYATHEGNNATWWLFDSQKSGGLRAIHAESTVTQGYWGNELKWNNYGMYYDSSNERQRVIRLVNESEGGKFYTAGQTIDGNVSGFHWYDENGYQTVNTGVKVTVDSIADGELTLTVSEG